jgi:hypothetical protein
MTDDAPIKTGQTWVAKTRGRLKGNTQIAIVGAGDDGRIRIERTYSYGKVRMRRDWITIEGLRRRYRLSSEQETLL